MQEHSLLVNGSLSQPCLSLSMEGTGKNVNSKGDTATNTACGEQKPEAGGCMSKQEVAGGKGPEADGSIPSSPQETL